MIDTSHRRSVRAGTHALALSFVVLASLGPSSAAQAPVETSASRVPFLDYLTTAAGTPAPLGALGDLHTANLTPDGIADHALLADQRATVLWGGTQYRRALDLGTGWSDLDVLPRVGPDELDGLLLVGPTGTSLATWDATLEAFSTAPLALGAGRAGAVAALPVNGLQLLAVLHPNLTTVTVQAVDGNGVPVSPAAALTLSAPSIAPHRLELHDRDADGSLEIVTTSSAGLLFTPINGAAPQTITRRTSGGRDSLAKLEVAGSPDELAWIESNGLNKHFLHVVDAAGPFTLSLPGSEVPVGLASGHLDTDGNADLAVSLDRDGRTRVLVRRAPGTGWPFDPNGTGAETFLLVSGEAAGANLAAATFADIDHDGDDDVVQPVTDSRELVAWLNDRVDAHALSPQIPNDPDGLTIADLGWGFLFGFSIDMPIGLPAGTPAPTELVLRSWSRDASTLEFTLTPGMPWATTVPALGTNVPLMFPVPIMTSPRFALIDIRMVRRVAGEPPYALPGLLGLVSDETQVLADAESTGFLTLLLSNELTADDDTIDFIGGEAASIIKPVDGGVITRMPQLPLR